jgi:hypothetical protein
VSLSWTLIINGKKLKLNNNIPYFKCLVRQSFFTKKDDDKNIFHNAYAFGIQSVPSKILTFHIITDYGMVRSRVPLSEIYLKEPDNDIPFHFKQLWDCFGYDVSVITYDFLTENRCKVLLRDKTEVWATYMFTVDWFDNPFSDEPSDYKCGHILVADDGYLLCMPNNRIFWKDSNWVTKDFPVKPQNIKVDNHLPSVESVSDRWVSEDSDSFYYEIKKID